MAAAHLLDSTPHELSAALSELQPRSVRELIRDLQTRSFSTKEDETQDSVQWRRSIIDTALDCLASDRVISPAMASIVIGYLERLREYQEVAPYLPPTDFPRAAHRWLRGEDPSRALAVAILFYYVGLHLLDDVQDGELPAGVDANLATTTATLCICSLPAVVLSGEARDGSRAAVGAEHRIASEFQLQTRFCTAGQFLDLDQEAALSLENARQVLELRNGSLGRLFGRVVAISAGCDERTISIVGSCMADIYIASQIMDDIENIWGRPVSSDALNLSKTLLLCYALEAAPERAEEIRRLATGGSRGQHQELRSILEDLGAFHSALAGALAHFRRASSGLRQLETTWGPMRPIEALIEQMCPLAR